MALLIVALCFFALVPAAQAVTLPPGFVDEPVASLPPPQAVGFTPDGRMLIAERGGRVRIFKNGSLLATPALDISANVCTNSERGMLGLAVDPSFAPTTNNYIYVFYTRKKVACGTTDGTTPVPSDHPVNRVSRFTLGTNDLINPMSELVLVDEMPSAAGNHNAGDVQFGKDGNLYISIGDGGCDYAGGGCAQNNDAARDEFHLLGKILRITPAGGIPADNPNQGAGTARCNVTGSTLPTNKCQETFAWGLRNPFRIAFDSNYLGTRFHINDVGQATWEEIDLGQSDADYGWNVREGPCVTGSMTNCGPPPAGMTNPIYWYDRSAGCRSITGGAFVPFGIWPPEYDGAYLFQDYVCGKIFRLVPDGSGGYTSVDFGTDFGANSLVGMTFGPNGSGQALYYMTYNAPGFQVRRIVYTGSRKYPTPTGGANFRAALVPAFAECTSPSGTHGGPLPANGSCSNPQPRSSTVTLGSSTAAGTRVGFASVDVCIAPQPPTGLCSAGALGGPAPDVRLRGNGSDVVCRAGAPLAACPAGPGSDYDPSPTPGPYTSNLDSGTDSNAQVPQPVCNPSPPNPTSCAVGADMTASATIPASTSSGRTMRITDRYSSVQSSGDPPGCVSSSSCSATVRDQAFSVPVVCRATSSPTVGSYCGVNTTANALVAGVVEGDKSAVVELGQFQVRDSGPDGIRANADDQVFAVQGIFIP